MWYSHEKLRGMIYVQAFSGESEKMSALPSSLCTTAFSVHLMIAFLIVAIFSCIPEHSPELVCARVLDGDTIEITVRKISNDFKGGMLTSVSPFHCPIFMR